MKEYAISVSKTHMHNLNTHRYYEYYHSSQFKGIKCSFKRNESLVVEKPLLSLKGKD